MAKDKKSGTPAPDAKTSIVRRGKHQKAFKKHPKTNTVTGKSIMGYSKARFDLMAGITKDTGQYDADRLRAKLLAKLTERREQKRSTSTAERHANALRNPCLPYEQRTSASVKQSDRNRKAINVPAQRMRTMEEVSNARVVSDAIVLDMAREIAKAAIVGGLV